MLSQLYIENVAVIEKATIEFHKGFNILTGETGAGKSIIIDSMHGIMGERTSQRYGSKSGRESAFVSAIVYRDLTETSNSVTLAGIWVIEPEEDGSCCWCKEPFRPEGKSTCQNQWTSGFRFRFKRHWEKH